MAEINKKIMAFTGSSDAAELVNMLSEYTNDIYAAVADEYGEAPSPSGNITLLSKYMDREKIISWIDRVGIDIVIDGISMSNEEMRKELKEVCESSGVEYFKLTEKLSINMNTSIWRSIEELARSIEYAAGSVLIWAGIELYLELAAYIKQNPDRGKGFGNLIIVLPPAPDMISKALEAGYESSNIICIDKDVHAEFIVAMFNEFNATHFVISGAEKQGLKERLRAVDLSSVKASVFGDIKGDDGMSMIDMWKLFCERFGIEDIL
ncbi:MAG: precorrin-6A/cobalt-precorrin-6A reductase [Firmicutes bacterium]|nr:precorrin-6A/cobalt-precorrin-6A reductase [Bacillota bacterium]